MFIHQSMVGYKTLSLCSVERLTYEIKLVCLMNLINLNTKKTRTIHMQILSVVTSSGRPLLFTTSGKGIQP